MLLRRLRLDGAVGARQGTAGRARQERAVGVLWSGWCAAGRRNGEGTSMKGSARGGVIENEIGGGGGGFL